MQFGTFSLALDTSEGGDVATAAAAAAVDAATNDPAAATSAHHRRSSTYAHLLEAADSGAANSFDACMGPPPAYLRGTVRAWYTLKATLARRVLALIEGPATVPPCLVGHAPEDLAAIGADADGCPPAAPPVDAWGGLPGGAACVRDAYGFAPGALGAARAAATCLVADLCGCGGAVPTPDAAIALLHEEAFESYNRWARMLGCSTVYSRRYDASLPRSERLKVAYVHATPPGGARHVRRHHHQQHHDQQQGPHQPPAAAAAAGDAPAAGGEPSPPPPWPWQPQPQQQQRTDDEAGAPAARRRSSGPAGAEDGTAGGGGARGAATPVASPPPSSSSVAGSDPATHSASGSSVAGSAGARSADAGARSADVGATAAAGAPTATATSAAVAEAGFGPNVAANNAAANAGGNGADEDDDDAFGSDSEDDDAPGSPIGELHGLSDDDAAGAAEEEEVAVGGGAARRRFSSTADGATADAEGEEDGHFDDSGRHPAHPARGGGSCCWPLRRRAAPASAAAGALAPSPPPPPPGSDAHTRLTDLALLYLIRSEAGCLRFCPEMLLWMFHQMRFASGPQPDAAALAAAAPPAGALHETGFFHGSCVKPLYCLYRSAAARRDAPDRSAARLVCSAGGLCGRRAPLRTVANSEAINFDDANEFFWHPRCLDVAWHCEHATAGCHTIVLAKTFYERAGYPALALGFWRWWTFLAVWFTACSGIARAIVDAGGINLGGIAALDPAVAAVNATACFLALAYAHTALVLLAAVHGAPPVRTPGCARRSLARACTLLNAAKLGYSLAWSAGLSLLFFSRGLLGVELFGTPAWFAAVGAKAACVALAETRVDALLGGGRVGRALRRAFLHLERVYVSAPHAGSRDAVLGLRHVRQPLRRVAAYSALWAAMLGAKLLFDTHILVQQWRLLRTLDEAAGRGVPLAPLWDLRLPPLVAQHGFVVLGSWASLLLLFALDSYIIFILAAAAIGYVGMTRDGVGTVTSAAGVRAAFTRGVAPRGAVRARRPLAAQFAHKLMPLAARRGGGGTGARAPSSRVFRRAWDAVVMSLRARDLVSNAEQARLMYGDAVTGVEPALPLFLYAGLLSAPLARARAIATAASRDGTPDAEFVADALPDPLAADAAAEVLATLPALLAHVAASHSAIGADDPHVRATLRRLFVPKPGQGVRGAVAEVLDAHGDARATVSALVAAAIALCVEFERDGAGVGGVRGSPLVAAACALLALLARVRGVALPASLLAAVAAAGGGGGGGGGGGDGGTGGAPPQPGSPPPTSAGPSSFEGAGPDLTAERGAPRSLAGLRPPPSAAQGGGGGGRARGAPSLAASLELGGGGSGSDGGCSIPCDPSAAPAPAPSDADDGRASTRTVGGIIRLLLTPCEGAGRLAGARCGDDALALLYAPSARAALPLEAAREAARRVFFLLTAGAPGEPTPGGAGLAVPEAERRLRFFVQSLYMRQLPVATGGVLAMPSFNAATPVYAETVLFDTAYLSGATPEGSSPLLYLRTMYAAEWAHFCERLGVDSEARALRATADAAGAPVSGEMELRLWASLRGQTLARAVCGVSAYASGVRLLAWLQLELEYAAADAAAPPGARAASAEALMEDAAAAAAWFTRERFAYVVCAQKYADHAREDLEKRAQIDALLLTHPLVKVVHFAGGHSVSTGARQVYSVCRDARGVLARVVIPGNPIADGLGEGKPLNQDGAVPFEHARTIQTLDMNQDFYLEEALKLPSALRYVGRVKRASGRVVAFSGLREHIFSEYDGSPAAFMSQGEWVFALMWQRLMASPLRVRFHYGHPDMWLKVWVQTRGGTAKASAGIHVSEDIFAGWNTTLRGGESDHIEFMQLAKGKDTGFLQVAVFEAKISGGSAIAFTSRDHFRLCECLDAARLASYFHTGQGFFLSNCLVTASMIVTLYYMAALALTRMDAAILATSFVYLVGDLNVAQWIAQLGLLTLLPLFLLYTLEYGWLAACARMARGLSALSPVFFLFGIQTKAYHLDNALAFGRQSYMPTGRSFVLRHVPLAELYRCVAHSHLYLGFEALVLLSLLSAHGTWESGAVYGYLFATQWLFVLSLTLGAAWFNPYQFEWRALAADARGFVQWLLRPAGPPEACWAAWHAAATTRQYEQATWKLRCWRLLRLSRLLLATVLIACTSPGVRADPARHLAMTAALAAGSLVGCEALCAAERACARVAGALCAAGAWLRMALRLRRRRLRLRAAGALAGAGASASAAAAAEHDGGSQQQQPRVAAGAAPSGGHGGGAPTTQLPPVDCARTLLCTPAGLWSLCRGGVLLGACASAVALQPTPGVGHAAHSLLAFAFVQFFAARAVGIASLAPLERGARSVCRLYDACMGGALLAVQLGGLLALPCARPLHARLLFGGGYADATAAVSGVQQALRVGARASAAAGAGGAPGEPAVLQLVGSGAPGGGRLDGAAAARAADARAVYRVGVRNYRLQPLQPLMEQQPQQSQPLKLQPLPLAAAECGVAAAASSTAGAGYGGGGGAAFASGGGGLDGDSGGGGGFGTFAIPGLLLSGDASDPERRPSSDAGAATPGLALGAAATQRAAQAPPPPPGVHHKSVGSILREHPRARPPPAAAATAGGGSRHGAVAAARLPPSRAGLGPDAPPGAAADHDAAATHSGSDAAGRPLRRRKLTGIDKPEGEGADAAAAADSDSDVTGAPSGGFAAMRARFEGR